MDCLDIASKIVKDYKAVCSAYLDGNGREFWKVAQVIWQTLCYTVQEGCQITLLAHCNELMVAATSANGGPLKLPIHAKNLLPAVQFHSCMRWSMKLRAIL